VNSVSEKFKHIGNRNNIRIIFRIKHAVRSSLMKTGWKEIYNRRHSVPIAFPVNAAEAPLAIQADLSPCSSMNIAIISKRVF
jgi:hypothetical protein